MSVAYGSTEIGRGAVLADGDIEAQPGSVGLPPPAVDARIDDDGELLLRGPTMFSGYLDRPDATAAAIDADGWFHTGDLADRRRRRLPHDHRSALGGDPLRR